MYITLAGVEIADVTAYTKAIVLAALAFCTYLVLVVQCTPSRAQNLIFAEAEVNATLPIYEEYHDASKF